MEIKNKEEKSKEVKSKEVYSKEENIKEENSKEVISNVVSSKEVKSNEVKSNEVKSKEVKSKEVKSKEIKSDEVKSKEEKNNEENNMETKKIEQLANGKETNKKPAIQVKDLYKIFRVGDTKVRALDGLDFTIYKGEFCSIVGTSGSGKSTLLNMLAGLEKPTKGQIVIANEHIEKKNENQLVKFRREKVGFIFQSFNLLGTMNATENVALPLTFQGVGKKERLRRAEKVIKLVGLTKHRKHKPTQMSGGQQQRVGVARALVVEPEIIFADEPTGNLDTHTSKEIMDLMRQVVSQQGKTLVMVTHDAHLANFADRVFYIQDGKIIKIDNRRDGFVEFEDKNLIEAID